MRLVIFQLRKRFKKLDFMKTIWKDLICLMNDPVLVQKGLDLCHNYNTPMLLYNFSPTSLYT